MTLILSTEGESLRSPSRNYGPGGGSGGSSSSGSAGQTRVKSSSPNESSGRSASSGHRTNGLATSDATKSSRQTAAHESGATSAVISRSRSPPVVTIAPTLSLTGLHYQDSRKVLASCCNPPADGCLSSRRCRRSIHRLQ